MRDYKISYIRANSTGMVVLLHIIQHFSYTYPKISVISDWLNLGLVMFFVISAFLYSKRDIKKDEYKKWICHRYAEIVVPSLFTTVCALFVFSAFGIRIYRARIIYSALCGLGFEAIVPEPWVFMQLWFLTYILICYITLPLIQKINFKKYGEKTFWIGVVAISAVMQGIVSLTNSPISWGGMLRFYLAYAVFKRYDMNSAEMESVMKKLGFLGIPCVLIIIVMKYLLILKMILSS